MWIFLTQSLIDNSLCKYAVNLFPEMLIVQLQTISIKIKIKNIIYFHEVKTSCYIFLFYLYERWCLIYDFVSTVFTKFKVATPNSVTYILQVIIEIKMTILTQIQFIIMICMKSIKLNCNQEIINIFTNLNSIH